MPTVGSESTSTRFMPSGTFSVGVVISPNTIALLFRPKGRPTTRTVGVAQGIEVALLEAADRERGAGGLLAVRARQHAHDLVGVDEPAPARLDHAALVLRRRARAGRGAARATPARDSSR